jgi:WhiB family transcriptional regulator, redox-sensing transcriptional regulator
VSKALQPPSWVESALCAQVGPDVFHPDKGESNSTAKRICNGDPKRGIAPCPVLEPCRDWALETEQTWGVYGGLSARERRKLRTEEAAA